MFQKKVRVEVAYSKRGLSKRTVVGLVAGNSKSSGEFAKWLFAPSKRTYKRMQTVWLCEECSGQKKVHKQKLPSQKQLQRERMEGFENARRALDPNYRGDEAVSVATIANSLATIAKTLLLAVFVTIITTVFVLVAIFTVIHIIMYIDGVFFS